MAKKAGSIKKGNVISVDGRLFVIASTAHTKPGKGGAFMQLEGKCLKTGTKQQFRFRTEQTVEKVILDELKCSYAFIDNDNLVVLHPETYEQIYIPKSIVGESVDYLKEGMEVTLESCNGEIISAAPPTEVTVEVIQADAVVRGQTATSSYKPAIIECGRRILVPTFVKQGDYIVVNTETEEYVRRSKES